MGGLRGFVLLVQLMGFPAEIDARTGRGKGVRGREHRDKRGGWSGWGCVELCGLPAPCNRCGPGTLWVWLSAANGWGRGKSFPSDWGGWPELGVAASRPASRVAERNLQYLDGTGMEGRRCSACPLWREGGGREDLSHYPTIQSLGASMHCWTAKHPAQGTRYYLSM